MPRQIADRRLPVVRSVLIVLLGGLLGLGALIAYTTFRIVSQGDRDERRPADAIVVMGAAQFDGRPGGVFLARLEHALELYQAGVAPYLVVTGGKLPDDRTTEAAAARAWAIANGVPAERILAEDHGRTTLESIEAVAAILRARGLGSAVFVSDRTHMLRVLRMATDQGIEAWGSPTATSPTDLDGGRRGRAWPTSSRAWPPTTPAGARSGIRASRRHRNHAARVFPSWRGGIRNLYFRQPPTRLLSPSG